MLLDTKATAERLGLSPKTLENWRCDGKGPRYVQVVGRVRYDENTVKEWLASNQRQSTAQTRRKSAA